MHEKNTLPGKRNEQEIFRDKKRYKKGRDTRKNNVLAGKIIAPRGFESLNTNRQTTNNKRLTENSNPVLSISLDKIVQKYPEIERIITAWPELPEHTKTAIKALVQTSIQVKPKNRQE